MASKKTFAFIAALSAGAVTYAAYWTSTAGWSSNAVLAAVFGATFLIAFAGMYWGG